MENLQLTIYNDHNYYKIFYLFAFTVAYLVIFYKSIRLKYDLALLSTVTAAIFLSFIIGCKTILVFEHFLFDNGFLPSGTWTAQMALGGVIFSMLVILLIKFSLNLPDEYWSIIGVAILTGLFLQKPGCLLAGCCKGFVVDSYWGVRYGHGATYLPLQLIEGFSYLLSIIILLRIKSGRGIVTYFMSIALFGAIQFTMEFFKNPADVMAFNQNILGLSLLQLIYGVLFLIALFFIRYFKIAKYHHIIWSRANLTIILILFSLVVSGFYLFHHHLFPSEILAINLAFIPSLVFITVKIFKETTIPQYRWASVIWILLPIVLMSQTIKTEEKQQEVYQTLKVGYQNGSFQQNISNSTDPSSCSADVFARDFNQKFSVITIGYAVTKKREWGQFSFEIDGSYGKIEESLLNASPSDSPIENKLWNINPYLQYDRKIVGFGLGLYFGENYLPVAVAHKQGTTYPETGLGKSAIYPRFHFRIGPKKILAGEYNFAHNFPSAVPALAHEFALGSGFNANNDFYFKLGKLFGSQSSMRNSLYLKAYIPIENSFVLEPYLGVGGFDHVYMLGLSYRFGHKETTYMATE